MAICFSTFLTVHTVFAKFSWVNLYYEYWGRIDVDSRVPPIDTDSELVEAAEGTYTISGKAIPVGKSAGSGTSADWVC